MIMIELDTDGVGRKFEPYLQQPETVVVKKASTAKTRSATCSSKPAPAGLSHTL